MTRESDNMGLVPYKLDPDSSVNSRQHLIAKTTAPTIPLLCRTSTITRTLTNKGNNKITELRTILQRESQNS
jgi:hypothetical protein